MRDHCHLQVVSSWTNTEAWQKPDKTWIDLRQQLLKGVGNLELSVSIRWPRALKIVTLGTSPRWGRLEGKDANLAGRTNKKLKDTVGCHQLSLIKMVGCWSWISVLLYGEDMEPRVHMTWPACLPCWSCCTPALSALYPSTQHPLSQQWAPCIPALRTLYPSPQHPVSQYSAPCIPALSILTFIWQ